MFAALANAAMGKTLSPPFDPFKDDLSYLLAAYVFEDVGVSAYVVRPDRDRDPDHGYPNLNLPEHTFNHILDVGFLLLSASHPAVPERTNV